MPTKEEAIAFLHCRRCVGERAGRPQIEASLTRRGIRVWCLRHDELVAELTPEHLAKLIARPPTCELCRLGLHEHGEG